jgi:predicted ATP-grasp superfamily ATP-dependent carboligase
VFAAAPLRVSEADSSRWMAQSQASSPIRLADIPPPGTVIEAGHPVFTVFSQGGTLAEVESDLRQCVANALERV